MVSCVKFPPPAGSRCSIIECRSGFNSLKNDWDLTLCPINTADTRFCADVMPGSQSQFCAENQSFGLMTQPTQIWTYGCSANFTVCSIPAQGPSLGPTSYPPTTVYPTTRRYPFTNNQPQPVGPATNNPAPNNVNAISSSSTAYTDFRTSTTRLTRYSQSDDNSPNKIGSVDSSIVIGCAVAGAIILVLLIVLLVVFLRRRRSKKSGNSGDIEWDDYTGKSRNQNGGSTTGVDVATLPARSAPNGNDKVNGLPPSNGNQPVQEQFINGHDNTAYNQQEVTGQTNGQSSGKTKDNNGGFSV